MGNGSGSTVHPRTRVVPPADTLASVLATLHQQVFVVAEMRGKPENALANTRCHRHPRQRAQACKRSVETTPGLHHHHSTPNLYRLGVFISGFRDTTRGSAPICMCHAVAPRRPEVARFDSLLLSVLSKPAPTSSPEHTQAAFRGRDLHVRHCHLGRAPGGCRHQAQADGRRPMIETLLGGLLGGAFRLAPEVLKWLDRKGERGHELAMQDKVLEFEKLPAARPSRTQSA